MEEVTQDWILMVPRLKVVIPQWFRAISGARHLGPATVQKYELDCEP
jgi:hypothetical protein